MPRLARFTNAHARHKNTRTHRIAAHGSGLKSTWLSHSAASLGSCVLRLAPFILARSGSLSLSFPYQARCLGANKRGPQIVAIWFPYVW